MDGPPPVEEDFSTLPIAERLAHKNWKARVNGYEALVKVFQATGSDTDPAFRPYINNPDLLKKIATDSNTVAQEKGVECLVTLVKYAGESAAKTRDTVVPALVDKCFGSTRAGTKTQAVELALQYVEVQNGGSGVVTDLLPGLSAKQPKTVAGCVLALKEILRLFGTQTTPPPPILKALPKIFSHSDKTVRAEGTSLTHVLYQYLGPGIEPWLADLKPVQVKGLKEAFDAMEAAGNGKGTLKPERLTRAHARQVEAAGDDGMEAVAENEEDAAPLDPLAFVEPVDVKLPPSLQTLLTSSKWEERKEVLDDLLTLLNSTPRIKDGPEIGELSKSLAIRIQGDANINCVMTAAACMQALAKAMLGSFARYRELVVGPMLERLKERKANVTDSIGDALDAVFSSVHHVVRHYPRPWVSIRLEESPQVKEGTLKFLGRCLSTASSPIQPAQIKPLAETLAILLEDGFEGARTEAATCLGTLMKMVGERPLNPVMEGLPDMRKSKVKEAFEWATVKCKAGAAAPPKAAPLPVAAPAPKKKAPAPKPVYSQNDKLGDLKLKKPAGDTLLVFAEKTSLRFVLNQAYDPLSKQKAPKVLADALTWINTALMEFGIVGLSLRSLIEFLKTALQNSNAAVRTSATKTLVTVKLFAGSSIKDFLEDLNAQLLNTINTEFDKVEGNPAPEPSRTSADLASMVASSSTSTGAGASGDPLDDLFPRVEVDGLLKGTTILADAKNDSWKTKKEGLEALQSILDQGSNKRLKSSMGDIGQVLKARVTDTNKAVQNLALDIVARIATGMGKPFEKHSRLFTVLPVAVLSDQKAPIRAAAIKALTAIAAAREGLDSMVQGLHTALEMSNPLQKGTLMHWIADWFGEHELASSLDLSSWTPAIVCSLDDRSPDVRKGAQALLPTLISSVGYDHPAPLLLDHGPHPKRRLCLQQSLLHKLPSSDSPPPESPTASSAPALKSSNKLGVRRKLPQGSSRPDSRADTPVELPPSRSSKTPVGGLRRPGATSSAKTSAPSTPPPSLALPFSGTSSDAKKARLGKDASKWINEGGPTRKDLADLLQTQMELHTSKDLVARWFSHDHNAVNDHLSGLTTICDLFTTAQGADAAVEAVCLANFDLPLKYASIKLHEPQPNLVSKCLEVVETVLAFLRSVNYQLTDNEALCFIPTVVYKLGDAREPVRVRVQQIMQEIPKVYAYSRLFQILLEHGLKSKVAKTRQGALDEMGGILKKSGMAACEPSKGFPIIAGMISGKDSQVRKSALGALGEGYTLLGEKVWTLVGPLPAKDKTQLEEPLRRVPGPSNSETPAPPAQVSRLAAARLGLPRPKFPSGVAREPAPAPEPRVLSPPPSGSSKIHEEIETSLSEGSDDITITISSIQLSSDPTRSVDALKKIQKILAVGPDAGPSSPQYRELAEHTEGLIETITLQMAHVFDRPEDLVPEENFRLAKHLVQTLNTFCDHAFLAESLTADILTSLLEELTLRLLETDDSTIKKVKDLSRFINMIVLRLFATGRRMSIFRALFALLLQIVKPFPGNGTAPDSKESKVAELVLKCVWKLARNIPQDLTEERLDPVELFPAIEHFLQSVPPNEWRARATNKVPCGDMPLRTIKVIIQHVVGPYKFTESSLFIYGGSSGHTSAAQGIATAGTQPVEVRRHGIRPVVLH
ncbi:armadillo-type protein [Mycena polygramma]|nr:armadillo-type protein [Mycena polygramma]